MLGVMVMRGSTFDNVSNLPEGVLTHLRDCYEGTRLGRQELCAELLEEVQGALWTAKMIDAARVRIAPELQRVVVAVDPSGTAGGGAGDDVGILVAGLGIDGRGYVLSDYSCNLSPDGWAPRVVDAYARFAAALTIYCAMGLNNHLYAAKPRTDKIWSKAGSTFRKVERSLAT